MKPRSPIDQFIASLSGKPSTNIIARQWLRCHPYELEQTSSKALGRDTFQWVDANGAAVGRSYRHEDQARINFGEWDSPGGQE